jgi:hypothetical protein
MKHGKTRGSAVTTQTASARGPERSALRVAENVLAKKGMSPMIRQQNGRKGLARAGSLAILALLHIWLACGQAAAATKYLITLPGHSWTPGSAPNRNNPLTQVAGETFSLDVYYYDDAANQPATALGKTSILSSNAPFSAFNPAGAFDLPDSVGGITYCHRTGITANLIPSATTSCTLQTGSGIEMDTTSVTVQVVDHFDFSLGSFTTGSAGTLTIQAHDADDHLCTAYHGTAALYAYDAGVNGSTVDLGNITFSGGGCTKSFTFYHATEYARFRVVKSNNPSLTKDSANFTIQAGLFSRLLIIGPGQTIYPGQQGGNGRTTGPNNITTTAQTAGSAFALTVYACDSYWNTTTASGETVTLTSSDTSFGGQTQTFGALAHAVQFAGVNLHSVGGGYNWLNAAAGSRVPNSTWVPLSPAALYNFGIAHATTGLTTSTNIPLTIRGYDVYGNIVNSVPEPTYLYLIIGGSGGTPISAAVQSWTLTPPGGIPATQYYPITFTAGTYTSTTFNIRKAGNNYLLRVYNAAAASPYTDSSTLFNVSPGAVARYLLVMPGQTYTPGERYSGIWGRSGSGSARTAGTAFNVSVVATDAYGNRVSLTEDLNGWNGTNHLAMQDVLATGSDPIAVVNGTANPSYILTKATLSQTLSIPTGGRALTDTGPFQVGSTALDHFNIDAGVSQTAGHNFAVTIRAEDTYHNLTPYAGPVYLTCPNLDYSGPTQSVIQVAGGTSNYNSASLTANWQVSGFSHGQLTADVKVWRAGTSLLFVSDVATDKPSPLPTGHYGQSPTLSISPDNKTKMFALVPGLEYRPGADSSGNTYFAGSGYSGTPLSQQKNTAFNVTVYATDAYWNNITDAYDQFSAGANPVSAVFNIPGQPPATIFTLSGGQRQLATTFSAAASYTLTFTNPSPGITAYTTPYVIVSFTLDHFKIEYPGSTGITTWTAGVAVPATITAYIDGNAVATTFSGTAALKCTLDHNDTLQVIRPRTVTFTNGVWQGDITLFRADRAPEENNNFTVNFGNIQNSCITLHVVPNDPKKLLIIESGGMTSYPGLSPDVRTDYPGAEGQPATQTAGTAIPKISFFLCDQYWNTVTDPVKGANDPIIIRCSDPYPASIDGVGAFTGGAVSVNLANGVYNANNTFKLFTVNGTKGQSIRVEKATNEIPFELGVNKNRVPVRHATPGKTFQFVLPAPVLSTGATAGVPFPVTIAAIDAYGNTLDSLNDATPFLTYNAVNLSAQTDSGGASMWPKIVGATEASKWIEGVSRPWIYMYKKVTGSENITATFDFGEETRQGTSQNFRVLPNTFRRLVPIVTGPGLGGMKTPDAVGAGGIYTGTYLSSPPPADPAVFNSFGAPLAQTAGVPVNLDVYSCDLYGNMIQSADDEVSMTSSDRFAPNPPNQAIVPDNGAAHFSLFQFHTRGLGRITVGDAARPTILGGTTPDIPVVPNDYYGLQILTPGLVAVEGSGNTNVSGRYYPVPEGGWYSGVTPTDVTTPGLLVYQGSAQLAGVAFPVTVQAADLYGNFIGAGPANKIKLTSNATHPDNSSPTGTAPAYDWMGSTLPGRAWFACRIGDSDAGGVQLYPYDQTDPLKKGNPDSLAYIQIAQGMYTKFDVIVNGVKPTDNIPVYVSAWPNTFTVQVEVRFTGTNEIVSASRSFIMEPMLDQGVPPTPAQGALGLSNGLTTFGTALVAGQSYSRAENIYLRVRDAVGSGFPSPGFSPQIRVRASAPASVVLRAEGAVRTDAAGQTSYHITAGNAVRVYATFLDGNTPPNPVSGLTADMRIISPDPIATTSTLGPLESLVTDSAGTMFRTFTAGAANLTHLIQASAAGVAGTLTLAVTVTQDGGVYPNPFNPLQGQVAHIDYPLERASTVKIYIYTLLGDLVWHKEFPAGDPEAGQSGINSVIWDGRNDNGVTVANGGYIAVMKADDQEKKRFKIGVFKEK